MLVRFINSGWFFKFAVRTGQAFAPLLPGKLRQSVPPKQRPITRSGVSHERKMLMLAGCVQPTLTPNTNISAVNLLDRLGIEVIEAGVGMCCGAAAMHTSDPDYALNQIRRLIDSWWPHIEAGAEAVVVTATGCGTSVQDFGRLLQHDPDYADKAATVSGLYRDLLEVVEAQAGDSKPAESSRRRIAVHTPCSMQHGLGINGRIERLLERAGYEICRVEDAHLCCGSAGTYSMLQPALATQLRADKIAALSVDQPEVIATANIGCQLHLAQGNDVPVVHWVELL